MTAINHALTGAIIGLSLHNAWLAVPVAVLSHFVCDIIPHFGLGAEALSSRFFQLMLIADTLLCITLVAVLWRIHPEHWRLAAICAFAAASPDLLWIRKYVTIKRGKTFKERGYEKLFSRIQHESLKGAFVELVWATVAIGILASRI